jgi:hypothetical protein
MTVDFFGLARCHLGSEKGLKMLAASPSRVLKEFGLTIDCNSSFRSSTRVLPLSLDEVTACIVPLHSHEPIRYWGKTVEVKLLVYGIKKTVLILGSEDELLAVGNSLRHAGFHVLLTPYLVLPDRDSSKNGFSNRMLRISLQEGGASSQLRRGLIASCSENDAITAWLSAYLGWDWLLGSLLGYPTCCIEAFEREWDNARHIHGGDLVPSIIHRSGIGPFSWHTNAIARYFGPCTIQHFPCTFTCSETIKISKAVFSKLTLEEPMLAKRIEHVMASPMIYTEASGVFAFPGANTEFDGGEWIMSYVTNDVLCTSNETQLAKVITSTDVLVGNTGKVLQVGDDPIAALICFG